MTEPSLRYSYANRGCKYCGEAEADRLLVRGRLESVVVEMGGGRLPPIGSVRPG
jgi:hypothetical protein